MKRVLMTATSLIVLVLAARRSQVGDSSTLSQTMIHIPQNMGAIHPQISPNGEWIAVSYHGSIWKLPRTGGPMTRLTKEFGIDIEPAWSPDCKHIAYVHSSRLSGGPVRLIKADDGSPVSLPVTLDSIDSTYYSKIQFHPDGRLVGRFRLDGKDLGLAIVDLKTGSAASLGTSGRFGLSADGQFLVYTQTMETPGNQWGNDGPQADLWKVSINGGDPEKVVRFPSRIYDVCWVANGQSLFVVSDAGTSHNDLWQIPLRRPEQAKRITMGIADEDRPSVSSDERWLLYSDNRRGTTMLVLRDLETGDDRTIDISSLDFREPTGTLRIKTVDKENGQPTTARVSIRQVGGQFVYPPASFHRLRVDAGHFYCEGETGFVVPAGKFSYRAFRGPEYQVAHGDVEVAPGKTAIAIIELQRWTHAAERGWYSGENHIHANYGYGQWYNTPESMLAQCSGEDLRVCNFMVANSDTDAVFDREFFRGQADPLSTSETVLYWNQEFRSTSWGHMTLVNLKQLVEPIFTGFKDTTNPWDIPTNADIADRVHLQKGLVNFTHGAYIPNDPFDGAYSGKSIPLDVALGKIDTLDLNNSYVASVPLWYRLLNCGFHLPATAGTDCFLNRIPSFLPGGDRCYVKIDGEFSYPAWIEGVRAGRSFVTSGPMLEFQVDDLESGATLKLASPQKVRVTAKASAQFPLSQVEIIYNGQEVLAGTLSEDKLSAKVSAELNIPKSGWILARTSGPIHSDHSAGPFEAHANPVYVEIAGQGAASREDAEYFLAWIDRLSVFLRQRDRIPSEVLRKQVEQQLESARAVYFDIVKRAL